MNLFPLPVVFTNWGFQTDWTAGASPLIQHCKDAGIKTVAVRLSSTPVERRKELAGAGLTVVGWENLNQFPATSLNLAEIRAVVPQIESMFERDATLTALRSGWGGPLPRAIVTTYAGLEQGQYAQLAQLGVKGALVECYAADGGNHNDLTTMLWQGTVYGIPADQLVAVCGTYRQETPASYIGAQVLGAGIGLYLAEPMTPDTWKAWSNLAQAPAPAPVPVDPKVANAAVVRDCDTWLVQQTSPKPLSRLQIERRIAANGTTGLAADDAKWVVARDVIKTALDDAGIP